MPREVAARSEVRHSFSVWASEQEKIGGLEDGDFAVRALLEGEIATIDPAPSVSAVPDSPGDYFLSIRFPAGGFFEVEIDYSPEGGGRQVLHEYFQVAEPVLTLGRRPPEG